MSQTIKGARVNWIGASKFGKGHSLGIKHADFDGFVRADSSIDLAGVEKGSSVDLILEVKGKDTVVRKLRLATGVSASDASSGGGRAPASGGGGSGWNEPARQQSIVMQASQKVAAELAMFFVEKGVIKLGAQPKQQAQIMELFDELSAHIFSRAQGEGLETIVASLKGVEAELDPATDAEAGAGGTEPEGGDGDFDDDFDDTK